MGAKENECQNSQNYILTHEIIRMLPVFSQFL